MKRNKCARCGKIEVFGRVFECIEYNNEEFYLCIDCAQILYKAEDARKDNNIELQNELTNKFKTGIKESTLKSVLSNWFNDRCL